MTEKKSRSAFLPIMLLVVGSVVCAGVVLAFVPMATCTICYGLGVLTQGEIWDEMSQESRERQTGDMETAREKMFIGCVHCVQKEKTTFLNNWFVDPNFVSWDTKYSREKIEHILEKRAIGE